MTAPRFHAARRIAAAPDRVWALLVDLRSWGAWNPTIVSIEGDATPGGAVRLVSTVNQQRTFALRVTELVAPQRMVWASGMPLGLFRGVRTYSLAPGDGGKATDFKMTEAYTGPLAGLIGRSIPDQGPSFEAFADALKAAAERG
jgi:uncharacterized protein YndB with AHSA1/START domain